MKLISLVTNYVACTVILLIGFTTANARAVTNNVQPARGLQKPIGASAILKGNGALRAVDGQARSNSSEQIILSAGRHRVRLGGYDLNGTQEKIFTAQSGHRYEIEYLTFLVRGGHLAIPDHSAPANMQRSLMEAAGALGMGTGIRVYVVIDRTTQRIASETTPAFQQSINGFAERDS